jgi:cell division protein FtsW (lipid II flippase)
MFGVGLGSSRQKFTWLPAPHNDAIFAVIGEELGLIGAALVILLFGLLGYRGLKIAGSAPDRFGMLIAVGASTWIMFQALFNIGGVTSAIPFTGITLPFVSYGGSSMVVTLASMGMVLNVSRQAVFLRKRTEIRAVVESPTADVLAGARLGQFAEPLVNTDSFHTLAEHRPAARTYRDWPEW